MTLCNTSALRVLIVSNIAKNVCFNMVYYICQSDAVHCVIHASSGGWRVMAVLFRHPYAASRLRRADRGRVLAFRSRIHRSCNNSAFVSGVNIVRNLAEVGTQYANFP